MAYGILNYIGRDFLTAIRHYTSNLWCLSFFGEMLLYQYVESIKYNKIINASFEQFNNANTMELDND